MDRDWSPVRRAGRNEAFMAATPWVYKTVHIIIAQAPSIVEQQAVYSENRHSDHTSIAAATASQNAVETVSPAASASAMRG